MTPAALLKHMTRGWAPVRFSNYPDWTWVHEELGPETRELVDPDGEWVIFVDGCLVYLVGEKGDIRECYLLEEMR